MTIDMQKLAERLDSIGRSMLERPQDRHLHAALLDNTHLMANLSKSPDLPIYARSVAREVETRANAISRAVESFDDAPLPNRARLVALVGELRIALAEFTSVVQRSHG